MTKIQIGTEAVRFRKKANDMEFFASTLNFDHQKSAKMELLAKAKELRGLQNEYERMHNEFDKLK